MEEQEKDILLIDDVYTPITEKELENLQPMVEDFVESYELNQDRPVEEWLSEKLQTELPDKTQEEVQNMAKEIVESVRTFESTKESLSETLATSRSKESWFAEQVKKATSRMSVEQTVQYLQNLDNAVNTAKEVFKKRNLLPLNISEEDSTWKQALEFVEKSRREKIQKYRNLVQIQNFSNLF